jgi:ribosomal protein S27AE
MKEWNKTEKGKACNAKSNKSWRERNRVKSRTHDAVKYAVKTGRLIKSPCEQCNEVKVQAHHDDYSKRLIVRWLCVSCHKAWHRTNKAING